MLKSILFMLACLVFVAATPVKSGYDIGDVVADFKLKNVTGKSVSLADYKNSKGLIVVFDCNTCPYSKAYNERIIALNKKYAPQGYPLVAIQPNDPAQSPGDSFEEMIKQAEKKKYEFPYLLDETQVVSRAFGATNTPHTFVLKNEGGTFKVAYIGAIDDSSRDAAGAKKKYVEEAIEALLSGKDFPTLRTKAVGCSIKWKNA
ncbi:MAG: thioredoxin family protein [Cyclobacteriaceae bacterium]|jgi:peroxiredoxin|nr:thioredoxin family protein [Cyclobacteriaceae bacterium]